MIKYNMKRGNMNTNINHPTIMEVNINNFIHNINEIKKKIDDNIEIMPIIKANAYGTYLNTKLDILNTFDIVGVANPSEGIFLRELGYKKDIFVLNEPSIDEINNILRYDLIVGISANSFIDALKDINKKIKIHIEIGTGMGRTGIKYQRTKEFINKIKENKNIIIDGIYTHLSSADIDPEYTQKQLKSFDKAIKIANEEIGKIRYIHALASNGIINFLNNKYNLVRPGLIMYGYESASDTLKKIDIKPVCTLKSKIIFIKKVPKNTSIGYGRSYTTSKETIIATIPMGYADGLRRCLSNKWYVVINKRKAPIIGNICMDSFMVDVSDIPNVKIGDTVYIWDNEIIHLEDIAKASNSINYEILCTISNRIPRIFVNK